MGIEGVEGVQPLSFDDFGVIFGIGIGRRDLIQHRHVENGIETSSVTLRVGFSRVSGEEKGGWEL